MDRKKLIATLKVDEGVRLKPYKCTAGKLTIGIGRNLDDVGITPAEAEMMLENDIDKIIAQCERQPWWPAVKDNEARAHVMVNMAFNLGINGVNQFKKTIAAIMRRDWETASSMMLESAWAVQVGRRAQRLALEMKNG